MTEKPFIPKSKSVEMNSSLDNQTLFASMFTKRGTLRKRRSSGKQANVRQMNETSLPKSKSPTKRSNTKRKLPDNTTKRPYNRKIKKEENDSSCKIESTQIGKINEG